MAAEAQAIGPNQAAPHACANAPRGCAGTARRGERYCEPCKAVVSREQDERRGTATERGYDWRWRKYSERYRKAHPLCVECLRHCATCGSEMPDGDDAACLVCGGTERRHTAAEVTDHIRPWQSGSTEAEKKRLKWDPTNHQALCAKRSPWNCHDTKTAMRDGAFGRPRVAASPGNDRARVGGSASLSGAPARPSVPESAHASKMANGGCPPSIQAGPAPEFTDGDDAIRSDRRAGVK